MLSLLFARRYLFSKKSHSVINIIAGVSLLSVAMPVAAMIILLSVFNGFESLVKSMASTFDADLTVSVVRGSSFECERIDTLKISQIEGVEAVSFVAEQSVMLEYKGRQMTASLRGVDDNYTSVLEIDKAISSGRYLVRLGDYDRLVLGRGVAHTLGLRSLAEPVNIYSLRRNSFSTLLPIDGYKSCEAEVEGIFSLDAEAEQRYILGSLRQARQLFEMPSAATALVVRCGDKELDRVKSEIEQIVGEEFEVKSRYQLDPTFYDIMTYEKWGIFFISLMVLIIAAFSIVGTLSMLIIEKRDEQITLRAMGADHRLITRIFIGEGLLIGAIGGAIGIAIGVGVTLAQQHLGIVKLPVESFAVRSYPVELRIADLVAVIVAYIGVVGVISTLTTLKMIPKKRI